MTADDDHRRVICTSPVPSPGLGVGPGDGVGPHGSPPGPPGSSSGAWAVVTVNTDGAVLAVCRAGGRTGPVGRGRWTDGRGGSRGGPPWWSGAAPWPRPTITRDAAGAEHRRFSG